MTCLLFCEQFTLLDTLLAGFICFCNIEILKTRNIKNKKKMFPSSLVQVVCQSLFFHDLASSILKNSHKWF